MKVVQINTVCGTGSTGKICVGISQILCDSNVENYVLYAHGGSTYSYGLKCSERFLKIQALRSRVLGNYGFNSKKTTEKLIQELEQISPDVVHLHNLHGHNVHLEMLFSYLKKSKVKIVWTFHDCWAFTAYCPYYDLSNCEKWKTGCNKCTEYKKYSWFFDRSYDLYKKKKELFSDIDLTIITPSRWLADQVRQSFLKNHEVKVINNGIDLTLFSPHESNFRKKYNIKEKFIVLGVAFNWEVRKGIDVFIELSKRLDERFQIVLVGTDDKVDQQLPANIISIHRTNNQTELAEIYTAATVFVNPTREENFPTTHIESLACGTPVITFDTGGSKEMLSETSGCVVGKDDIDTLEKRIIEACCAGVYSKEACVAQAIRFRAEDKFLEYLSLYYGLVN